MCNQSIPRGIVSFLEKSQSESILSELPLHTHAHTFLLLRFLPVDSFDSCNLPCICYNWLLSLETGNIKSVDPMLRLQSRLPTNDIRSERGGDIKTAWMPRCCSRLFICVAINKANPGWLLVLPLQSIF